MPEYTRPLGTLEVFFKALTDQGKPLNREHWTVHLAATLEFPPTIPDPVPCLACAWQVMRLRHSALEATIGTSPDATTAKPHLQVGEPDVDSWVESSFSVCPQYTDANHLFSELYTTKTATCHWLPKSSQLVLRSSHWRIDGIGMSLLFHDLMSTLVTTLDFRLDPLAVAQHLSEGSINLPPLGSSLEALAHERSTSSKHLIQPLKETLEAGADVLVAEFLRGVPSIGLPTIPGSEAAGPGPSKRVSKVLDSATTTLISSFCRRQGIKLSCAVHAAIVRITATFPQHALAKHYTAFVPVDLRRTLGEPLRPVGLNFSGLPAIAQELGRGYNRDHIRFWTPTQGGNDFIGLLDLVEPYVERTTILFNTPTLGSLPPIQTPDLSSLGKFEAYIDKEYGRPTSLGVIKVGDIWIGTEMLNRCIQFHVWSWNGALHLGACFNSSFYDADFVDDVMERILQDLKVGCNVKK
ncbi:hypothetical protein F5Y16DRAFT_418809 [Xylariaceae sp. FL0255]|nr:hypothetical protein F5Y16DRAFT_418809 [Xylariaceae sp. FL0255]